MHKPRPNWSDDQKACIECLSTVFGGRHHLSGLKEWGTGVSVLHYGDLSTYDGSGLTMLVLQAHRDAVRIEVAQGGPGSVRIIAHKRRHDGATDGRLPLRMHQRHPSIHDLARMAVPPKRVEPNIFRKIWNFIIE